MKRLSQAGNTPADSRIPVFDVITLSTTDTILSNEYSPLSRE